MCVTFKLIQKLDDKYAVSFELVICRKKSRDQSNSIISFASKQIDLVLKAVIKCLQMVSETKIHISIKVNKLVNFNSHYYQMQNSIYHS